MACQPGFFDGEERLMACLRPAIHRCHLAPGRIVDRLLETPMVIGEDNLDAEQITLLKPRQEITPKRAFNTG